MSKKYQQNIYHLNENVNLKVEKVIRIKSRIMINVDVGAKTQKNIMHAKSIISRILLQAIVKMLNI